MHWLPQETIVFDKGRIKRELIFSISSEAEALIIEPIISGRLAVGETELSGYFDDKIEISIFPLALISLKLFSKILIIFLGINILNSKSQI